MAKTLKQIMASKPGKKTIVPNQDGYTPKTGDEKKFAAAHKVDDHDSRADPDNDAHFDGSNVTTYDRAANRYGYNRGQDKDAYFAPGVVPDRKVAEELVDEAKKDTKKETPKDDFKANAADLVKKVHNNFKGEQVEEIDEVSKALAGRYLKKASADMSKKKAADDDDYYRRKENYDKVVDHLTKEDVQPRHLRDIVGVIIEGEVVPFKEFQKRRAEMISKQKWDEPRGEVKNFTPKKKKRVANEAVVSEHNKGKNETPESAYGYDVDVDDVPHYGNEKFKNDAASTSFRNDGETTKDTDTPAQKRGREAVAKEKASNADRSIKRPAEREYVQMKDVPEEEQIDEISKSLARRYMKGSRESEKRFRTLSNFTKSDAFRNKYDELANKRNKGSELAQKKINDSNYKNKAKVKAT